MKNFSLLFGLFFFSVTIVFGQIPKGIDPSTVSKQDLDKYGVTEADLKNALSKYDKKGATTTTKTEKKTPEKKVEKQEIVKPKPEKQQPADKKGKETVFGRSFFDNGKLSIYERVSHQKATDDYVLGAGDEISISIWGYSEHNGNYTVDQNGSISPNLVGKIYLKGINFAKAKKLIKSRFGKVYDLKNSQISIEINYSKVIRVNIVGEVRKPGTYSVNAINSAFNILSLAGGITDIGSIRAVSVIRGGKEVKKLDLYKFLLSPKKENDYFLLDNDYLVVKPVKSIVTVSGAVNRPMQYELLEEETFTHLINIAGGFAANAHKEKVQVVRIIEGKEKLVELKLKDNKGGDISVKLNNGDRLTVMKIPSLLRNYVKINGAVNLPGNYAFNDSLTLKKLINKAGGLDMHAELNKIYILSKREDLHLERKTINLGELLRSSNDVLLKEFDEITIFSKEDFIDRYQVDVKGAVRKPQKFDFSEGLTLADVIFMSGGLKTEASSKRIEVSRVANFKTALETDSSTRIVVKTIDLSGDLSLNGEASKFELQPMDIVFVRNVAEFELQQNVTINGEVKYPGTYSLLNANETLKELIERAGGITQLAFLEGATIRRPGGEVSYMVLDLHALLVKNKSEFNYVLKAGDEINIPKIQNLVSLSGALEYPKISEIGKVHVPFKKGKRARYYVNKFGAGFADNANRKKLIVTTPGGYVKRTHRFLWINFYPKVKVGDHISVERKEEKKKEKKKSEPVDWNKAIENTTVKLTAVLTLWILIDNAFNNN